MSTNQITVAILGAKGKVGGNILAALTQPPFSDSVAQVRAIGSKKYEDLKATDASKVEQLVVSYDDLTSLTEAFNGVDMVINALNFPSKEIEQTHHRKSNILQAVKASGAKVYLPSEFGIDWRSNDFKQQDWSQKLQHQIAARSIPGLKVVGCYVGLFRDDSFGSWFGWRFGDQILNPIGDATQPSSYTSLRDVGLSIASLASIFAQKGAKYLPDHLRISGSKVSADEMSILFSRADVKQREIKVEPISVEEFEGGLRADAEKLKSDPAQWIRLVMGKGELDLSRPPKDSSFSGKEGQALGPDQSTALREFVNDGSLWKWQTVEQYALDTKGRPWLSPED